MSGEAEDNLVTKSETALQNSIASPVKSFKFISTSQEYNDSKPRKGWGDLAKKWTDVMCEQVH